MQEIEKKYLVKNLPDLTNIQPKEITQAYLSYNPEIRIRKKDNEFFLTRKSEGNLTREEIETNINNVSYNILCTMIAGNVINKDRYEIKLSNNLIAELDIYKDNLDGLITVEVEFENEIQADNFIKPDWFFLDVTNDSRYKNKNLARATKEELTGLINKQDYKLVKKIK